MERERRGVNTITLISLLPQIALPQYGEQAEPTKYSFFSCSRKDDYCSTEMTFNRLSPEIISPGTATLLNSSKILPFLCITQRKVNLATAATCQTNTKIYGSTKEWSSSTVKKFMDLRFRIFKKTPFQPKKSSI